MTDYSLWEVILNGDSPIPTRVIDGVVQPVAPTTAEQMLAKKNELKAHDLEDQSLDDLFNSLKIYEAEVKSSSSTSPTTQNISFVSSQNTDSTNESVSAVASISAASSKVPVAALPNVDTLSHAQIDVDDLEEIDLKWQMAMLTMRARKFLQRTGRNLKENGPTSRGFDVSKVEFYNCHRKGYFPRECSVMVLEAMIRAFRQRKNQPTIPLWHLPLQVLPVLTMRRKVSSVPPPYTGTFMPSKPDLVFHDALTVNETIPTAFNIELSPTKPDKDLSQSNRPTAPIIEDWVSDSEDDYEGEPMSAQMTPSFVYTFEHEKAPRPSVKPVEYPIPASNLKTDILKPKGHGNSRNRKACFVCKSLTHLIQDCDYYEKKMVQTPARNHVQRGNHQHYARMTHPNPQRHVVPIAVLTRSKLVPLTAARPVTAAVSHNNVIRPRPAKTIGTKPYSLPRRAINLRPSPLVSNFPPKITTVKTPKVNAVKGVKGNWGNPQHALKDKEVIDSGYSRHMTGNMSYLTEFEEINGGYFKSDECNSRSSSGSSSSPHEYEIVSSKGPYKYLLKWYDDTSDEDILEFKTLKSKAKDDDDSSDEDFQVKVKKAKTCKGKSSKSTGCKTKGFNSSRTNVVYKPNTFKSLFLDSSDEDMPKYSKSTGCKTNGFNTSKTKLGKENRVNILKSIDEGPFQMGTFRETLVEGEEGAFHLGPERPRVYSDLSPKEKNRYNADIRTTNILLQGLPKDIYTLINHYTDAKDIWDNVKMLLKGEIAKVRKVKSPFQLVDKLDKEPAQSEPEPELEHQACVASEKTKSRGDTEKLQINEEQGKDVDEQVNLKENTDELDQGQAGSDPVMDEDQAGPDPRESRGDLAGPEPTPMHDEGPNMLNYDSLFSMKNLEDAYAIGDQFINDKYTKDEPKKPNEEAEVVSMVTVLICQTSSSVPPLSTPVPIIDLSHPKPASSTTQAPIFTATATTTTTTLPPPP
nr:ribonuclease H-like domain-containing protein [Tanacetum cinerariifolium]